MAAGLPSDSAPVPDRVTIWPFDDGRYGLDATFQGVTGFERAEQLQSLLRDAGADPSLRQELGDGWSVRIGDLTAAEVSKVLSVLII